MSADDDRAVEGETRVDPESTATLIAGLDEILAKLMEPQEGELFGMSAHAVPVRGEELAALAIRAQLATALAVEHAALELALTREILTQVAERWEA